MCREKRSDGGERSLGWGWRGTEKEAWGGGGGGEGQRKREEEIRDLVKNKCSKRGNDQARKINGVDDDHLLHLDSTS